MDLTELLENARRNEALLTRLQAFELQLLSCQTWLDFLTLLLEGLPDQFDLDAATLKVCDPDGELKAAMLQALDIDQGVLVRAQTSVHTELLTPGEFVQVCFVQNNSSVLYEIPYKAILRIDGITHIFYFDGQSISLRPVHIISQSDNKVTVSDEFLSTGYVVEEGVSSLKSAWQVVGE